MRVRYWRAAGALPALWLASPAAAEPVAMAATTAAAARPALPQPPTAAGNSATQLADFVPASGTAARAAPGGMVVIGPPLTAQGNEVQRSPDGLFYVTAIVNGAAIRFLVDTGATVIVLRPDDARRAGLKLDDRAFNASAETANGRASMAQVVLEDVVVGETRSRALRAAVVRDNLQVSLLGQSWLSQLASLTISGDRMLFN